jgi:hypothetical protein
MNQGTMSAEGLKFALCEEFADEKCLPTDYVYLEFVDPHCASLEEVQFVLSRF